MALAKIERPEIAGNRFRRLLEPSDSRGASSFEYDARTQLLSLIRTCDNRGVTTKVLGDKIDRLLANLEATRQDWDFDWDVLKESMPLKPR